MKWFRDLTRKAPKPKLQTAKDGPGIARPGEVIPATKDSPPIIGTQWGDVSETARLQAVANIRLMPEVRDRVLDVFTRQCDGNAEKGLAKMKLAYPECFDASGVPIDDSDKTEVRL